MSCTNLTHPKDCDCEDVKTEGDGVRHPLPQDAIDAFDEYVAALNARDEVLTKTFKWQYKKAVYFGRIATQSRRLFWKKVREIYPELAKEGLTYHQEEGIISLLEKEDNND